MTPDYTYAATVLDVHDGDTVKVSAKLHRHRGKDRDLGFHVHIEGGWVTLHAPIRLLGLNAPELTTPDGKKARDYLLTLIGSGDVLTLRSSVPARQVAADKYGGRWDGVLTRPDGLNVNEEMVKSGHAAPWDGQGTKPLPKEQ